MLGVNLRKLPCIILIMAILVGGLLLMDEGHATTPESGIISANTTWTTASSPYYLTGMLTINSGVTLTIEPGVMVDLGINSIFVGGTLNAQGTSYSKIVFLSSNYASPQNGSVDSNPQIAFSANGPYGSSPSSKSIIDNAVFYGVTLMANYGSPQITNNYFASISFSQQLTSGLITVSGGSPLIEGNVINVPTIPSTASSVSVDGIYVSSGSPTITNNLITGQNQNFGIYISNYATLAVTISNNNITDCWTGIYTAGQSNILQNNIMFNVNDGIDADNTGSYIRNNVIANNSQAGISGINNILIGTIQNNTIVNNNYGVYSPSTSAVIQYNNIFGNYQNVHLTSSNNVNAVNNWWGTNSLPSINQTIWDKKYASTLGTVQFNPPLQVLNPSAPSVPSVIPIPTPPPSPAPVYTPSPSSAPTPTPTFYFSPTPTPTPFQDWIYSTPTPSPTPTQLHAIQPPSSPSFGNFSSTDIDNIAVIAIAFTLAVSIIVGINLKFGRTEKPKSKKQRKRTQKSAE